MPFNLAPRVTVYPFGSEMPALATDSIALPQLRRAEGESEVFGDGSHATTRLCAIVLDLLCRQRQPRAVLDVGTGTGVLARIARARGASLVVGTDIDAAALASAAAHARLDSHSVAIELSGDAPDRWGARFDLIVANILEGPLTELAPALARALTSGGVLLISGFMRPQAPALRVRYERFGLIPSGESCLEGWVLLTFARP